MAYRLLNMNEIEDFAEENKKMVKSSARAIRKGACDLVAYADIVKAWKKDYKKVVTEIVPVTGEGDDYGEIARHVVYEIRTKDGETRINFANRSTMNGVDYANMRIGQAVKMIERMAIK